MKHYRFSGHLSKGAGLTFRPNTEERPAVWISSFPRSGNTFVRSLLANYFSGLERPLRLPEITELSQGEHFEKLWTRLTGKTPVDRDFKEQWKARLAYFALVRNMTSKTLPLIKTHTLLVKLDDQPAFKFVPGDRIIHVVRHPCDVAVSLSSFSNVDMDEAIKRILTPNRYVSGQPEHGFELTGSWSQHSRSWLQDFGTPVHHVRYIDLVENTATQLMGMVKYLGFEPDLARAQLTVDFCSFNRLRSEEREKGFREASSESDGQFFRVGRPGQWLDKMTVSQARRVLDSDPELIEKLGLRTLSSL